VLDVLDRKVRQMHAALDALSAGDLSGIALQRESGATYVSMKVDFNSQSDPIELANAATLLIANIASLKDHLKAWCRSKGLPFHGESLIDNNNAVGLIHDLWNVDKHAELTRKPRSGSVPRLKDVSLLFNGPTYWARQLRCHRRRIGDALLDCSSSRRTRCHSR
jgi:hypothetical protein